MPTTQTSKKHAPLTANGTTGGKVTIADNEGWLPGAIAYLNSTTEPSVEVKIVAREGSAQLLVRRTDARGQARGAVSDVSEFLVADGAKISMAQQVVAVNAPFTPVEKA